MERNIILIKSPKLNLSAARFETGIVSRLKVRCYDGSLLCETKTLQRISTIFSNLNFQIRAVFLPKVSKEILELILDLFTTGECQIAREQVKQVELFADLFNSHILKNVVTKIVNSESGGLLTVEEIVLEDLEDVTILQGSGLNAFTSNIFAENSTKLYENSKNNGVKCMEHDAKLEKKVKSKRLGWSSMEVETLRRISPLYRIGSANRFDLRGIAAALLAEGFNRTVNQVKKKMDHLKLKHIQSNLNAQQ